MNQTVTANISGIVFHIEVDAYEELKKYLNKIKSYFKDSEECAEIMQDIDSRIAELFSEKITSNKQVINQKDVDNMIVIMGKPEQYIDDEDQEESNDKTEKNYADKKLFRDTEAGMIGGVSAGLSAYFGIDTVWLRLFFVIGLFLSFGFLLYIILWIVIPEAKTAKDRLQMKGEPINIKNIGKTIEKEANKLSEELNKMDTSGFGKKLEKFFTNFFNALASVLKGIFKVLGKIIGIGFLIFGLFMSVLLIASIFGSNTIFSVTNQGIFSFDTNTFLNLIFESTNLLNWSYLSFFIVFGIPLIVIILMGIKLIFTLKTHFSLWLILFIVWVVGLSTSTIVGLKVGESFSKVEEVIKNEPFNTNSPILWIKTSQNDIPGKKIFEDYRHIYKISNDSIYNNNVSFDVQKSKNDSSYMQIITYSHGNSNKDALNKIKATNFNYSITDSLFQFDSFLSYLKINKIRGQHILIKLYLQNNKQVFLDKSLKYILNDVDNITNTFDKKMVDKKWVMLKDGLTCLDCEDIVGITSDSLNLIKIKGLKNVK